jgi:hypothetical protein
MSNTSVEPSLVRRPGVSDNFRYLAYPDNLLVRMSDAQGQCNVVSPLLEHIHRPRTRPGIGKRLAGSRAPG